MTFIILMMLTQSIVLAAEKTGEDPILTSLSINVLQKHDKKPINNATCILNTKGEKYKGITDRRGMCVLEGIKLDHPVLQKGTVEVYYEKVLIYSKTMLLFNLRLNKFNAVIIGDIDVPAKPELNVTYNYTNEKFEKFSGTKDPYSEIYINGELEVKATPSTNWKTYRKLDPGLNTLIFIAKNIWSAKSKPYIFHITYFPVTRGEIKFCEGPKNVRSERGRQSSIISWEDIPSEKISGYNVYRTETHGKNYRKINDEIVKRSPYSDNNIGKDGYYYVVTAVTPEYETAFSKEVSSISGSLTGTDIPDTIEENTVLTSDKSPYLVSSDVKISGDSVLTIEPGVKVMFKKGDTSLSGKIISRGGENAPVTFMSNTEEPEIGHWKGIEAAPGSNIKHSKVQSAGYGGHDAVSVTAGSVLESNTISGNASNGIGISTKMAGSSVLISDNTVSDNGESGIYTKDIAEDTYIEISGNEISGNYGYGISTEANTDIKNNNILSNGYSDTVAIKGGFISNDVTWDAGEYKLSGSIETEDDASLNLAPGVTVKAAPKTGIKGKIVAEGTENKPIIFTSQEQDRGKHWDGLILDDGSDLENCTVSYVLGPRNGIYLKGKDVDLIEITSYFTEQRTGFFDLDRISSEAIGEEYKEKEMFSWATPEILLLLVVLIPIIILGVIMTYLKNRKQF